jgi:hypothetical protein
VRRMAHHPSLAMYTGCNECMGLGMTILNDFVLRVVASEDNSRRASPPSAMQLVCAADGCGSEVSCVRGVRVRHRDAGAMMQQSATPLPSPVTAPASTGSQASRTDATSRRNPGQAAALHHRLQHRARRSGIKASATQSAAPGREMGAARIHPLLHPQHRRRAVYLSLGLTTPANLEGSALPHLRNAVLCA